MTNTYYAQLLETLKKGNLIRKTVLQGKGVGDEALFFQGKLMQTFAQYPQDWEDPSLLSEVLGEKVHLVLCGGGHVAKELYTIATQMEMDISVLDEREEFCNPNLYPKAELHCSSFSETLSTPQPWVKPYFVIITRGHGFDQLCLEKILTLPHSYIGMIGSKNKVATTMDNLRQKGYEASQLASVHSPIGLSIGAVTASEIAISIMAEIISVYRKEANAVRLDPKLLATMAEREHYIVSRVVRKTGSAPCDVGFQIAVFDDGTTKGTVGGGLVEAKTIEHAQTMLQDATLDDHVVSYGLDSTKAGSLGMICGGDVQILFQRR